MVPWLSGSYGEGTGVWSRCLEHYSSPLAYREEYGEDDQAICLSNTPLAGTSSTLYGPSLLVGVRGKESIGWQDSRVTGTQYCLEEDPNDPLMILILL